ncbi:winged helix-turn-helix domain-containing protein [Streptomyces ipomoeae]|uniref:winged helix-turn-helix domain-containing protein n=1 Tax=Streptomyces ipomoeae TaxID=103232 RepID=UPI001146492A|nr:winged helix-turn-helix domain-containing protein [Streptomyces ipomoeae]TQE33188.1 helix-turn-helix domain-containing protein [Streptomyces ipomoeae]
MSGAALVWAMKHKAWCQSTGELAVLTAIADHMDRDLRNSYASQTTLAEETLMSPRSVGTHMRALAKRGVIVPGDPAVVQHIRADRRPPVWDFPADLPRRPPAGGNDCQSSGRSHDGRQVATDATRKTATGGKKQQPRVETVADEPVTTEPGTSVGGDGRRPSTGGDGRAMGGEAASGKASPPRVNVPAAALRAVTSAIPKPLASLLEQDWSTGLPADVNQAVAAALGDEQRTVEELVERMERRWSQWAYEDAAVAQSGDGIARPLGVLLTLLGPSACWGNNIRCEDGIDLDTGAECPRCVEAREDKAAKSGSGQGPLESSYSVPFQRPAAAQPSPYVRCEGAGCGVKMLPTADGLCRECRSDAPATARSL